MNRPAKQSFPIPSWLEQPADDLLPLLVFERDVQRLLCISRATVLCLVSEGKLKGVTMPDKSRRITLASVTKYFSELTGEPAPAMTTGRLPTEAHPQP